MTPAAGAGSGNAVILERIEGLRCDMSELKGILNAHMADERKAREEYLVDHAAVVQKADAAHRRLDVIEPIVTELQRGMAQNNKQLESMNVKLGYVVAILGTIGTAVGLWLIGQLLGML